jgi:DnaJ-class molecular chaperone
MDGKEPEIYFEMYTTCASCLGDGKAPSHLKELNKFLHVSTCLSCRGSGKQKKLITLVELKGLINKP